jgi:glycosyltransferase involved in cell wall biosynthesis
LRLLFLSKRHPQQRDLIERPYGRFHHLPTALAGLGHEVTTLLCSHRRMGKQVVVRDGVRWSSHDLLDRGPRRLVADLTAEAEEFRPDWVIGCSDAWYGWLARVLAIRTGARLAIDAYDNFEAYMRWNLPLHWKWRRAVRAADLVTAAGPQLAGLLQSHRHSGRPVEVLPMTADPEFVVRDRLECRRSLGLPTDLPLLGYIGSWSRSRGSDLLMDAFSQLRNQRPEARLVISGRPPDAVLGMPNVIGIGYISDAQLPLLVSALDVACVVTADSAFGRFSYPAKLCEAMACKVPVVATATDALRWMLADSKEHLAPLGDSMTFAQRAIALLDNRKADYIAPPSWTQIAGRLEVLLASGD